jgi:hypothetical protein
MPISSDRGPGVQIGPIASVGSSNTPVAPIGDLMDAFKSGFITVDDIVRRGRQNALETDRLKTELQSGDFQRKLAPGAFDNSMAAQGLQADQIQAAKSLLPGSTSLALGQQAASQDEQSQQAALRSPDDTVRDAALSHEAQNAYERATGAVAPKSFKIAHPNPEPVPSFSKWINETKGPEVEKAVENFEGITPQKAKEDAETAIQNFTSGFPLNSPEDNMARAKFANEQEANLKAFEERRFQYGGALMKSFADSSANHAEFKKVEDAARNQKVVVKQGTPEYNEHVRGLLTGIQDRAALREAQLKAAPKIFETRAEAPVKAAEDSKKTAMALHKDYGARQEIQDLRKVQAAVYKLENLLDPSAPPSAARDQGAVFSWMKILDPGSTVREGEYATAKNARGVPEKFVGFYNQALTGQILTPAQRTSFKEAIEPVFLGQVQAAAPTIRQFLSQEGSSLGEVVPPEDAALLKRLSPSAPAGVPPPAGVPKTLTPEDGPHKGKTLRWVGPGPTQYEVVR